MKKILLLFTILLFTPDNKGDFLNISYDFPEHEIKCSHNQCHTTTEHITCKETIKTLYYIWFLLDLIYCTKIYPLENDSIYYTILTSLITIKKNNELLKKEFFQNHPLEYELIKSIIEFFVEHENIISHSFLTIMTNECHSTLK